MAGGGSWPPAVRKLVCVGGSCQRLHFPWPAAAANSVSRNHAPPLQVGNRLSLRGLLSLPSFRPHIKLLCACSERRVFAPPSSSALLPEVRLITQHERRMCWQCATSEHLNRGHGKKVDKISHETPGLDPDPLAGSRRAPPQRPWCSRRRPAAATPPPTPPPTPPLRPPSAHPPHPSALASPASAVPTP